MRPNFFNIKGERKFSLIFFTIFCYNKNKKGKIMKSNISLFADICNSLNIEDQEKKDLLWKNLEKYNIKDNNLGGELREAVDAFLNAKDCDCLSANTLNNYKNALKLFVDFSGDQPLADLTIDNIRNYIIYLRDDRGIKKSSIQQYIAILKTFFSWLKESNRLQDNFTTQIKPFKIDKYHTRTPLTEDEQIAVCNACITDRERAIISFFLRTGCRVSEAINIKQEDIDWENNSIIVLGKGNKYREVLFDNKTKNLLKTYLSKSKNKEYLFAAERWPYAPLTKNGMEAIVSKIGVRAGLSQNLYPHKLRHTFATNCLNAGMDLPVLSQLMGHSELSTTMIYAKLNNSKIRDEYKLVSSSLLEEN